ncbi:MAG: hypothetical protein R3B09_25015 [Nannocystaceae bacterium]
MPLARPLADRGGSRRAVDVTPSAPDPTAFRGRAGGLGPGARRGPGLLALAAALACAPQPRPPTRTPTDAIPHATAATVGVRPAILAAQLREPTLADLEDGRTIVAVLYLVLSVPVDPVSIDPEHFLVAMDDGRRVRPARVLLSAAGVERQTLTLAIAGPPPLARAPAPEAPSAPQADDDKRAPRSDKKGRPLPEASSDKRPAKPGVAADRPVPEASSDKRPAKPGVAADPDLHPRTAPAEPTRPHAAPPHGRWR